jgi:hypothetical protein
VKYVDELRAQAKLSEQDLQTLLKYLCAAYLTGIIPAVLENTLDRHVRNLGRPSGLGEFIYPFAE